MSYSRPHYRSPEININNVGSRTGSAGLKGSTGSTLQNLPARRPFALLASKL